MPGPKVAFEASGEWLYFVTEKCLSALLMGGILALIVFSFRFGVDRGQDTRIHAPFFAAICANLSTQKYGTGRYVCSSAALNSMMAVGLYYDDATLARMGKSLPELLKDASFLNNAVRVVFLPSPPREDGGVVPIGWGLDAGFADFVDLAFRLFGYKIESAYLTFFFLLAIASCLICIQFSGRHFVLFSVFSFHYIIAFTFLNYLEGWALDTVTNPSCLTILAVIPLLHALFLMAYGIRPSPRAALLFLPQAVLMVATGDFRAAAYWTVIALGVFSAVFGARDWWRGDRSSRQVMLSCWPSLLVFICLAFGIILQVATTDRRLAAMGGMRLHTFWEPLYYNLQLHPDWNRKYSMQHHGAAGDHQAFAAVESYRARHHVLDNKEDYVDGNKELGITQVALEKYMRAAFIEFFLNDPWFVIKLKYYNLISILSVIEQVSWSAWVSAGWRYLTLAACVALGLVIQTRRKAENLSVLSACTASLVVLAVLAIGPVWATVANVSAMVDVAILGVLASFMLALWAVVSFGVLISSGAAASCRVLTGLRSRLLGWPTLASCE